MYQVSRKSEGVIRFSCWSLMEWPIYKLTSSEPNPLIGGSMSFCWAVHPSFRSWACTSLLGKWSLVGVGRASQLPDRVCLDGIVLGHPNLWIVSVPLSWWWAVYPILRIGHVPLSFSLVGQCVPFPGVNLGPVSHNLVRTRIEFGGLPSFTPRARAGAQPARLSGFNN